MIKKLRQFLSDTSGNTALFFALGAIPLMAATGAAIDYSRATDAQAALQVATDAAALAAGTNSGLSDDEVTAVVNQYFAANVGESLKSHVTLQATVNRENNSLGLKVVGKVDTTLLKIVGIGSIPISVTTEVNLGSQYLELALVLDNTGSMDGQKIIDLKVAANEAVQILSETVSMNSKVKIGIVPFASYVNLGPVDNSGKSWIDVPADDAGNVWKGCVGSRPSPLDAEIEADSDKYAGVMSQNCPEPIIPLTDDFAFLKTTINNMSLHSGTYIPGGLLWGWHILDDKKPFDEALSDSVRKKLGGRRAIILMTDGDNTRQSTPASQPDHESCNAGECPIADSLVTSVCNNAKADGVLIYTVGFQVPTDATKALLRDCASEPAKAYDAQDGAALKAAFSDIVSELGRLRLTQ